MKKISKKREAELDEILDQEGDAWDDRELGHDPEYAEPAPEFAKKKASVVTTIRMTPSMVKELKELADLEGLAYQTLIKSVLTKYIREKKSA